MQKNNLFDEQIIPWFKTKTFKILVWVIAILSIATVVLFSEQIGNLLELLGLKAATEAREILIDGSGVIGSNQFLEGASIEPPGSIILDSNYRLILNPDS